MLSERYKSSFYDVMQKVYDRHLKEASPIILPEGVRRVEVEKGSIRIKACGVHNPVDLMHCVNSGIDMIGIQCFVLDQRAYFRDERDPLGATVAHLNRLEFNRSLSIPWAELQGIQEMLLLIRDQQLGITPVIMTSIEQPEDIQELLKTIVPSGYNSGLMLQLDGQYNTQNIAELRKWLNVSGFSLAELIQCLTFEDVSEELMLEVNNNPNISYVCLDSSRGQAVPIALESLVDTLLLCNKSFMIAGGLSSSNAEQVLRTVSSTGKKPFALDLQSSIRLAINEQKYGLLGSREGGIVVKPKFDRDKMTTFQHAVYLAEQNLYS